MKKTLSIINKINANRRRIEEIKNETESMPFSVKTELPLYEEQRLLTIENKILHDNARYALYELVLPVILEVLKKYNGKPYGDKTREKINAEIEPRTNCRVYFEYDQFTIYPDHKIFGYIFGVYDFNIYTVFDKEKRERVRLLQNNKIQALTPEDFYLSCKPEYVTNVKSRAKKILKEFIALKEKHRKFEEECSTFNKLIPSGIDNINPRDFRNYLI